MYDSTYEIYLRIYGGMYQGVTRDHHGICIDTYEPKLGPNGKESPAGLCVQVIGNVQTGMVFDVKSAVNPLFSYGGKDRKRVGTITRHALQKLIQICRNLLPPAKQLERGEMINPDVPLYRCQEWTADAIQCLVNAQIFGTDENRSLDSVVILSPDVSVVLRKRAFWERFAEDYIKGLLRLSLLRSLVHIRQREP